MRKTMLSESMVFQKQGGYSGNKNKLVKLDQLRSTQSGDKLRSRFRHTGCLQRTSYK